MIFPQTGFRFAVFGIKNYRDLKSKAIFSSFGRGKMFTFIYSTGPGFARAFYILVVLSSPIPYMPSTTYLLPFVSTT